MKSNELSRQENENKGLFISKNFTDIKIASLETIFT